MEGEDDVMLVMILKTVTSKLLSGIPLHHPHTEDDKHDQVTAWSLKGQESFFSLSKLLF